MERKSEILASLQAINIIVIKLSFSFATGVYPKDKCLKTLREIITEEAELPISIQKYLLDVIEIVFKNTCEEIQTSDLKELKKAIAGMSKEDAVKYIIDAPTMLLDEDTPFVLKNGYTKEQLMSMKGKIVPDHILKAVGDRVVIKHELFTNMLVTTEGIQLPSESFSIPAAPELANIEAIVLEIECNKFSYLCGACSNKHTANTKIAFPDYTMEFYIHNSFLILKTDD